MSGTEHRELYLHPRIYDIAFDVRETARECDFMAWCVEKLGKRTLTSALELGAGPGYHAREFARRGLRTVAVDVEPAMADYLRATAAAQPQTASLEVVTADMRACRVTPAVDLAFILFGSFGYLLTADDARRHVEAVHASLNPGGVYIIELPHPRRFLRADVTTQDEWVCQRDGTRVHTRWDIDRAVPDPLTHVMDVRSLFEIEEHGRRQRVRTRGRQRAWFAPEIAALFERGFRVLAWFGAMDRRVEFNYGSKAWRMVVVLQRV